MKEFVEKLIERLEESVSFTKTAKMESRVGKKQTIGFVLGVRSAVKIVKDLAEEHNNGWISVENELPPQPEENTFFEGKPLELYLVSEKGVPYPCRAFWNGKCFTDGFSRLDVEAWKPMPGPPAPYKKGE